MHNYLLKLKILLSFELKKNVRIVFFLVEQYLNIYYQVVFISKV